MDHVLVVELLMYFYIILEILAIFVGGVSLFMFARMLWVMLPLERFSFEKKIIYSLAGILLSGMVGLYAVKTIAPSIAMPPWMHTYAPGGFQPDLPLLNAGQFFWSASKFARIADIGANPNIVPPATNRASSSVVKMHVTTREVISEVAPGVYYNYWTFDGQVPGPMLRARVGDDIDFSITNDITSLHPHSIDLHAVQGPGGGAKVLEVNPGETKSLMWRALNPGLYIYHCATMSASSHNAHGQYGLILIEPEEGLPAVDREFYIAQGELYSQGEAGRKGLVAFDANRLVDENPTYITFNGRVEDKPKMHVKVGEKVRMYVGNGGVAKVSSFHIIGTIFDKVYPEGAIGKNSALFENVQTTIIPAGGAAIVEFTPRVPGRYVLVDHALARLNKGAWATLVVGGETDPAIYKPGQADTAIGTPMKM